MKSSRLAALFAVALTALPLVAEPGWVTNQSARLVIGQTSFTRQNPTPGRNSLGSAAGVAVANNRLFVAGGNRLGAVPITNRVLIYNNLDGFVPRLEDPLPQDKECPACVGLADVVLGQPDFTRIERGTLEGRMNTPSGIASDGTRLAVADTNNNRVLIWNSIPASNDVRPDIVVGQPSMNDNGPGTTRERMRGPQGVWIDIYGRLFVADTQNSRVLIYNQIPSANGAPADYVLGQPDFETRPEPDLTQAEFNPTNRNMLDPISVTVDALGRMFVADLGFNRVLIFFSVPSENYFPADVVIGQPNFESGFPNNSQQLCEMIGPFEDDGSITPEDDPFPPPINRDPGDEDEEEEPLPRFPRRCEKTLNFPRFALSDGTRLYIADSGNDRVLVFNEIPIENGAAADAVLGQPSFIALTDSAGAANMNSPTSLAHDGTNLYVADPFMRRILVFTPAENMISLGGIVNGASYSVPAFASVEYRGSTAEDQLVTVKIANRPYEFRTEPGDTATAVRNRMIETILADPDRVVEPLPFNGPGTFARGGVRFGGSLRQGDRVVLRVGSRRYEHTVGDPADDPGPFILVDRFSVHIRAENPPDFIAERDPADVDTLLITARNAGDSGNSIGIGIEYPEGSPLEVELSGDTLSGGAFPRAIRLISLLEGRLGNAVTVESTIGGAGITTRASGARLQTGSNAKFLPAGSFATIFGQDLADGLYQAGLGPDGRLPKELGGVEVYCNGIRAPIYSVSPEQINFQVPWEVSDPEIPVQFIQGISTYVRRTTSNGVMVSIPRANEVTRAAPGLFTWPGKGLRQAVALHGSGIAEGTVAISRVGGTEDDETAPAGVTVTISVAGRSYSYTTQSGDDLAVIRDQLVNAINADDGDPLVTAQAGREGFFSARATVTLRNNPNAGNVVEVVIDGRRYAYTAQENDTAIVVRNVLVQRINEGLGDPAVTARSLEVVGTVQFQVVARELGTEGNDITFSVAASEGSQIEIESDVEETLGGGQTPPVVVLFARQAGRQANEIGYSAETSDPAAITATPRQPTLCCGNEPFSVITEDNPAVPGETITLFASGLGFTSPKAEPGVLVSGEPTPPEPQFTVPFIADDFVSSLAAGRTATVRFVGLAPGMVGIYQLNLRLNEELPDDPLTPLHIAQQVFWSNTVTVPVKNLRPRDPIEF